MNKVLIAILIFFATNLVATAISYDTCQYYVLSYQDAKLKDYLKTYEKQLNKVEEKIIFHYFSALLARFEGNQKGTVFHLESGLRICNDYKARDTFMIKYYDQFAILNRYENREIALDYINKSIALKKDLGDSNDLAKSYLIKGNIYFGKNEHFRNSDSCKYYYRKTLELSTIESNIYLARKNLNTILFKNKEFENIESNFLQILSYEKKKGRKKPACQTTISLLSFYIDDNQLEKAQFISDTLLEFLKKKSWNSELGWALRNKIKLLKKQKQFSDALIWQDSLLSFELNNKDKSLDQIRTEQKYEIELSEAKANSYRNKLWLSVLGGTTGTLLLILFGLYKFFGLKRKAIEQELETTKIKASLDTTKAKMEGEQQQRQAIAAVLHDEVATLLTAADMHLKVAEHQSDKQASINKAEEIIKDVNNQVRALSHELVSPTLLKFGLESAVDSLVARMENDELTIEFESNLGSQRLERNMEIFIYQSCSELVQNVIKHSNGDHCDVALNIEKSTIILVVEDNGTSDDLVNNKDGLGLAHIRERAIALGGDFEFKIDRKGAKAQLAVNLI